MQWRVVIPGYKCQISKRIWGHLALAEGRTKDALQFYKNAQRRYHKGTSVDLYMYCARALSDEDSRRAAAKETDKPSLLPQAKSMLLKALHLDPGNYQLRFNLAYILQVDPLSKDGFKCFDVVVGSSAYKYSYHAVLLIQLCMCRHLWVR